MSVPHPNSWPPWRKACMMGQEDSTMTKRTERKWFSSPIRLHRPHRHKEISHSMLKFQQRLSQHSNRQRKQKKTALLQGGIFGVGVQSRFESTSCLSLSIDNSNKINWKFTMIPFSFWLKSMNKVNVWSIQGQHWFYRSFLFLKLKAFIDPTKKREKKNRNACLSK